jgi:hypothetical protein
MKILIKTIIFFLLYSTLKCNDYITILDISDSDYYQCDRIIIISNDTISKYDTTLFHPRGCEYEGSTKFVVSDSIFKKLIEFIKRNNTNMKKSCKTNPCFAVLYIKDQLVPINYYLESQTVIDCFINKIRLELKKYGLVLPDNF